MQKNNRDKVKKITTCQQKLIDSAKGIRNIISKLVDQGHAERIITPEQVNYCSFCGDSYFENNFTGLCDECTKDFTTL